MKTIIAGSRGIMNVDIDAVVRLSGINITEVVSGGARGVDRLGEWYAERNGIPVKQFLPQWETQGKAAGHIRNKEMAAYGEALIAIWDGKSKGTQSMIQYAKEKGLRIYIQLECVI